jgi:vacuolar iron transporter family protein
MPQTPHVERHFTGGDSVRDVVIGMSDGLTVPFALAAGLSGAVASARVVVVAGLAEIAAGSIAMGLGGFLAAKSDAEHYEQELARESKEVATIPEAEASEVSEVFESYGLTKEECQPVVMALRQKPKAWVSFHDAVRTRIGRATPWSGSAQRVD